MNKLTAIKTVALILLSFSSASAQSHLIDSIMAQNNMHDTTKIRQIIDYGNQIKQTSTNQALIAFSVADSLAGSKSSKNNLFLELQGDALKQKGILYWQLGQNDIAVQQLNKALDMFTTVNSLTKKADVLNTIGIIHASQAHYDEAITFFKQFLEVGENLESKHIIARAHNNFGLVFWNKGNYNSAIEEFLTALRLNEELGNRKIMGGNYNNIGNIHKHQGNLKKAIEYYRKSLEIAIELDMKQQIAGCYNNIGVVLIDLHREQTNTDSMLSYINQAIQYYDFALAIAKEINDQRSLSMTYNNIGSAYHDFAEISINHEFKRNNLDKAKDNYTKSISIKEALGDKNGMSINYENLAEIYLELAKLQSSHGSEKQNLLGSALLNAKQSMQLATEIGSTSRKNEAARALLRVYKEWGNFPKALEFAEIYISTRDSLFSKEKTEALTEMETRYQTEKKEQEIVKQRLQIEKHKLTRNLLIAGISLGFALALAILVAYIIKRRSNKLINYKNKELEQANAEILAQRDEIESQRDMVVSQRDRLEQINTHMTNSLRYAQSIQGAILPSEKLLSEISTDYFVFMKPCELVSGDFFWATTFENYRIFCVADCTGHGVPGAFMSILGITALNEIVSNHRVTKASDVLGYLRASVIDSLSQNDPQHLHKDGMDIGLCIYNNSTHELQFAGARIPLWLVTSNPDSIEFTNSRPEEPISNKNNTLLEVKGDIMPVGISPKMESFENNSMIIKGNSVCIYLATDGFADQFGQKENAKFTTKRLKNLILEHAEKPFSMQEKILDNTFEGWKGMEYQIDDVTILGLKL